MILNVIFSIIGISLYTYIGVNIYQQLIDNKKLSEDISIYFFAIYFVLFLIIIIIIIIIVFHSRMLNQTGPTGPIGFRGNIGSRGYSGECSSDCYKIDLRMELINFIQDTYNELLKENNVNKNIDIKNIIKEKSTDKIVDIKLKNNKLNDIIDNITYSQEYQDAINEKNIVSENKKKTTKQINEYIKSIIKIWITDIYNSLKIENKNLNNGELNFFIDKYANENNTKWNTQENPFDKIQKYDLYKWGKTRVFKPINIFIDNNPNNSNYLPQDGKPPLKLLHSNHHKFLYENKTHETKDNNIKKNINKYPTNKGSIWKNNNVVTYRKEKYYPVGDLIIGPDNDYETTDVSYIKDPEENETYEFQTIQDDEDLDAFKEKYKGKEYKGKKIKDSDCIEIKRNIKWDYKGGFMRKNEAFKKEKVIICPRKKKLGFNTPNKETILVTGDVADPEDYKKLWDNTNSYEKMNMTIWRPECPYGYESLSDVATIGTNKPTNSEFKCVPKDCLTKNENKMKTILKTYDNEKIIGYSDVNDNLNATNDNSYNFFRFKTKEQKPLYTINEQCKSTAKTKVKPVEDRYKQLGYGWHGRPVRNPKYSIFSYLVQMPEAIISNKETNYKYYVIHADLYDSDNNIDSNLKTSAKNLYYILTLNYNNYKYDRCFSTFKDGNDLIRTRIRSEDQSYWIIEKVEGTKDEIRLKSKKTGKYFQHNRNNNLRRDIVKNRVFEKQIDIDELIEQNKDSIIFVNIKSAFGTNVETALEDGEPRIEEKYYLNDEKNIINQSYNKDHIYPKRGIQTSP